MMSTDPSDVRRAFAEALSSKDRSALMSIIDPAVDFRGPTPSREWRATNPDDVVCSGYRPWEGDTAG